MATCAGWDTTQLWSRLSTLNPNLRPATRSFVDEWVALARERRPRGNEARDLIRLRERRLKAGRARLDNPAARDAWAGDSGLGLLDYRWSVASRHLNDIYAGLGVV